MPCRAGAQTTEAARGLPVEQDRARPGLQAGPGRREELATARRSSPLAEGDPRYHVHQWGRGRQPRSSTRCRLTPPVTNFRQYLEGWRRKPILYTFAAEYRALFGNANKRAATARQRSGATNTPRRDQPQPVATRLPLTSQWVKPVSSRSQTVTLNSPIRKSEAERSLLMGEKRSPSPAVPNPRLEAALDRWRRAIDGQHAISGRSSTSAG